MADVDEARLTSLISTATNGATYEERWDAVDGLREFRDSRATDALLDVLFWHCSDDFEVLARDERRMQPVIGPSGELQPTHPPVSKEQASGKMQFVASIILRERADPYALKRLLIDDFTRYMALGSGESRRVIDELISAIKVPEAADTIMAFLRADPAFFPDEEVRERAQRRNVSRDSLLMRQLGVIGDKRAVGLLIEILNDRRRDRELKAAAASALGELGDSRAVDSLVRASIGEYRVALAADNALYELVGPEERRRLKDAATEEQNERRRQRKAKRQGGTGEPR